MSTREWPMTLRYDAWTGQPGAAGAVSGFSWPALALALDMTVPTT
jgi:hypothetical protein